MEMMKAAVMTEVKKIEMQQREKPQPKADEVQVKVEYVGVCGSDVHYFEFGRVGNFVVEKPIVLGHECGGTITAVGSDVKKLKVGDHVALEPGVPCGKCEFCLSGRTTSAQMSALWQHHRMTALFRNTLSIRKHFPLSCRTI